jgi:hypothetical protein
VLRGGHSPPWPRARTPPSPRASTPPSLAARTTLLTSPAKLSHASSACSVAPSVAPSVASLASSLSSVISRVSAAYQSSNKKRPVFPSALANSLSLSRSRSMHLPPRRYLQLACSPASPPPPPPELLHRALQLRRGDRAAGNNPTTVDCWIRLGLTRAIHISSGGRTRSVSMSSQSILATNPSQPGTQLRPSSKQASTPQASPYG